MLNINIPTIVFQIINFLLFTAALYFLLFKRIVQSIDERAKKKENLLRDLEDQKVRGEQLVREYQAKLDSTNEAVETILKNARQSFDEERRSAISELEVEANRILGEAEAEVEQRQSIALEQYHDRVIDQVIEISESTIAKAVPPEVHSRLVQELADEIWRLGREDLQRVATIRSSLRERVPVVFVETALPLNQEQQGLLIRTFSALSDRDIKLDVTLQPRLAAGCRVRLGDLVVDNTLGSQIEKIRDKVAEELKERNPVD